MCFNLKCAILIFTTLTKYVFLLGNGYMLGMCTFTICKKNVRFCNEHYIRDFTVKCYKITHIYALYQAETCNELWLVNELTFFKKKNSPLTVTKCRCLAPHGLIFPGPFIHVQIIYHKSSFFQTTLYVWTNQTLNDHVMENRKSKTMQNFTAIHQMLLIIIDGDWDHELLDGL